MKITHIGASTVGRLQFNDLGKEFKGGVTPDEQFIALDYQESMYLPDSGWVLRSAQKGDIKKYVDAGYLQVDDVQTLANNAEYTIEHDFNYAPQVTAVKAVTTTFVQCLYGTDYTAITNAALTETVFKNVSGGTLDFVIHAT